jgi:hypothetical protein
MIVLSKKDLAEAMEDYLKKSDGITVRIPSEVIYMLRDLFTAEASDRPSEADAHRRDPAAAQSNWRLACMLMALMAEHGDVGRCDGRRAALGHSAAPFAPMRRTCGAYRGDPADVPTKWRHSTQDRRQG